MSEKDSKNTSGVTSFFATLIVCSGVGAIMVTLRHALGVESQLQELLCDTTALLGVVQISAYMFGPKKTEVKA